MNSVKNLVEHPEQGWMKHLNKGSRIWLVKEQTEAVVEHPYSTESQFLSLYRRDNLETWVIDENGNGSDGHPLIRPIAELTPTESIEINRLQEIIEHLQARVEVLEESLRRTQNKSAKIKSKAKPKPKGVISVTAPSRN